MVFLASNSALDIWRYSNKYMEKGWKEGKRESEKEEKRRRELQNRESGCQRPILKLETDNMNAENLGRVELHALQSTHQEPVMPKLTGAGHI